MNTATRAASISAVAALVLAAVWFLWPSGLGGGTTYVSTHGISMEPKFHTGDLAVLRAANSYAVGDVVAYRSPSLGITMLHRIVEDHDGTFVTRGDNNGWNDPDRWIWLIVENGDDWPENQNPPMETHYIDTAEAAAEA